MLFQPDDGLSHCSRPTSEDPWTLEGAFCLWVPEPRWSLTHTAAGSGSSLEGFSGARAQSISRCSHGALSLRAGVQASRENPSEPRVMGLWPSLLLP